MFSEVNVKVEDGNLGRSSITSRNAQVKIGVSGVMSSIPLLITGMMKPDEIREKLGNTPLADACIDATENGLSTIYAIPVKADINGSKGEVTHTGTGSGTLDVSGNPNNAYDIVIKIKKGGKANTGSFKCSVDGGNSYLDETTIPLSLKYEIPGTGLAITFTNGSSETAYVEGDVYSFSTTAPGMNNNTVLKAVEMLNTFNKNVEICHIVGTSVKVLWAALQSKAEELLNVYKKPVIFLLEGRRCGKSESVDEYLLAMENERKGITSKYLCVVPSYGIYTRKDLRTQEVNFAGLISGLIGRAKESLSIGCVEEFPISSAKLIKLVPEGIENYSRQLDELGYTVLRQYVGKDDFYVSNANVMAKPGSDFPYVESVRVLNRIVREVSMKATDKVQTEIDPENLESSIKVIEAYLNIAVEECENDKIISSGEVSINNEGLNILADETLNVNATWVPMGTARRFNLSFAVSNPAVQGGE